MADPTPIGRHLATGARRRDRVERRLPEGCPVVPLGGDGTVFYYLNAINQLVCISAQQHSKNVLTALFAPRIDYLIQHFPKTFDKETGDAIDFKSDLVARALMEDAQLAGKSWEPGDNIRGRGAWLGEDADLVVHLGSAVLAGGQPMRPGKHSGKVYPLRPDRPPPAAGEQEAGANGPAAEVLALVEHWAFAHPELHPRLLLGWIASSFLCGALPWRPHLWIVAPRGSGKSTFFEFLGHMLAKGEGVIALEDASPAALRIKLQYDALPVALDETEPAEDNTRINALLGLLRLASSGGTSARGTADHGSVQQTLRFAAICASVVRPALKSQDASRITLVEMLRPGADRAPPTLRPSMLLALGNRLHRRMLDAWPRYFDTLARWKDALQRVRLDNRMKDQIGALLAAQWLALHDEEPDSDTLEYWADLAARATAPDRAEDQPEWFRCLELLAHWRVRAEPGKPELTVAELLERAAYGTRVQDPETLEWRGTTKAEAEAAQTVLSRVGLRFEPMREPGSGKMLRRYYGNPSVPADSQGDGMAVGHLAIANAHPELAKLFDRTQWAARAGTSGAWKGVLEGAPGAVVGQSLRFGARTARCVCVPLELAFNTTSEGGVE